MRSSRNALCLAVCWLCAACEFHAGDSRWDAGHWNWGDDDAGASPADAGRDAGGPSDDDASTPVDAAVSGNPPDANVPPDASGEPATPDDVAAVLARGSCGALARCLGASLLAEAFDGRDCVELRTQIYADGDLHWLAESVARGRVTFRPERLARCESDLIAFGCEVQSRRLPASCEAAVEGAAEVDGACAIDQECGGGAFCDRGMLATCPGTCVAPQAEGLPCRTSAHCSDGYVCRAGLCSEPLGVGAPCSGYLGQGECAPGLACQVGESDELECQPNAAVYAGKLDESCDVFGVLCEPGLVCQSRSADREDTAGVCTMPAAAGDTCRLAVPAQCPPDYYCKDKTFGSSARVAAGAEGLCAELPAGGAACETEIGCRPGAYCDETCHVVQSVGGSCDEGTECFSGSCVDNQCAPPLDCRE
ncbi:MAG: Dickkopf N-terminal cysteine-rich domain-containing protein [Polyangiales bacterium]